MEKSKEMIKCSMGRDNLLYFNNQDNDNNKTKNVKNIVQKEDKRFFYFKKEWRKKEKEWRET